MDVERGIIRDRYLEAIHREEEAEKHKIWKEKQRKDKEKRGCLEMKNATRRENGPV
jgi:hypothetical protein